MGKQAGRGEIGRIEIGYVASAALGGTVSDMVRSYRQFAPDVDVHLRELETPRQIEEIARGRLDIGFIRARTDYPPEIRTIPLRRNSLLIALQADHPLARRKSLRPADLATVRFLVPDFGEEAGFLARIHELGQAGGFTPLLMEPVRDFLTVLTAVAAGLGFGLVPASVGNLRIPARFCGLSTALICTQTWFSRSGGPKPRRLCSNSFTHAQRAKKRSTRAAVKFQRGPIRNP